MESQHDFGGAGKTIKDKSVIIRLFPCQFSFSLNYEDGEEGSFKFEIDLALGTEKILRILRLKGSILLRLSHCSNLSRGGRQNEHSGRPERICFHGSFEK